MTDACINTDIITLGEAKIPSPIRQRAKNADRLSLVSDDCRILIDVDADSLTKRVQAGNLPSSFELAGPRKKIFLTPASSAVRWSPVGDYARV